jgi:electron transport complex protein RnfD
MEAPKLIVTSSPHLHARSSTASIMWNVSIALAPAALWGVYVFGLRALLVLGVSIATAVLAEFLLGKISRETTIQDGSAFLTGLLIGMNMPSGVKLFVPILASIFAIAVAKWIFGGLGANWINPALAGRVFVFFSFTGLMSSYTLPRFLGTVDSVSGATMLTAMKLQIVDKAVPGLTSSGILTSIGYPSTGFAQSLSESLNGVVSPYALDAFFGLMGGSIGEVSALLLLVGAAYLLAKKIITWHIPVFFLGTFSLFAWVLGGLRNGMGLFQGDVLLQLCSGGMMLGAFFMATDMVTSPTTAKGMCIFGAGIGFFTFLLRYFGSLPESVSLAIVIMNIFTPTIEKFILPKRFGEVEKKTRTPKEAKS